MKSDLQIAQEAVLRPIVDVAAELGLAQDELVLYGRDKAKISLSVLDRLGDRPQGRYIDVTAVNPTPMGEGKTVTTVGLGQALGLLGKNVATCIRQPSLGPVFGIKGGAAGGGYAQVVPMEDFNLHLTGDVHAVTTANNLLAAFIDNHIFHGNELGIDEESITWRRVVDLNDRSLREVRASSGGNLAAGPTRVTSYDISAASEVMAILAMSRDLHDMRARLGRIVIGFNTSGEPVTAEDLQCAGAMAVIMRDAISPNLLQNLQGGPVLVHAGPFANIAPGNSSIVADRVALALADYVVTESGFGADMGAEKFFDIKCRVSGLKPDCAVLVSTVRALKAHSGHYDAKTGLLAEGHENLEDLELLAEGLPNLEKHIENLKRFGIPVVAVVNAFPTDSAAEHELINRCALAAGADFAVVHHVHAQGSEGGIELAEAVIAACELPSDFRFLYPDDASITDKIEAIATQIYGADGVEYFPVAQAKIRQYAERGWSHLPICMAKTQFSLSHDPARKGRPTGWTLPIRDIRASIGAGFLYPLCGDIMTMPGLPKVPAGNSIDIDAQGNVVGMF